MPGDRNPLAENVAGLPDNKADAVTGWWPCHGSMKQWGQSKVPGYMNSRVRSASSLRFTLLRRRFDAFDPLAQLGHGPLGSLQVRLE
jgi:hypothetical protein